MTRINATIKPSQLCDQHLLAEYRELPRIFTLANKKSASNSFEELPEKFTLGKGHVKFFYDKLYFLATRYEEIVKELQKRGYTLDQEIISSVRLSYKNSYWYLCGDFESTPEAHALLCIRLKERLKSMKKITFSGVEVSADQAFERITYGAD
jgi:deoxyribonuclease (pyrimidine dimer)